MTQQLGTARGTVLEYQGQLGATRFSFADEWSRIRTLEKLQRQCPREREGLLLWSLALDRGCVAATATATATAIDPLIRKATPDLFPQGYDSWNAQVHAALQDRLQTRQSAPPPPDVTMHADTADKDMIVVEGDGRRYRFPSKRFLLGTAGMAETERAQLGFVLMCRYDALGLLNAISAAVPSSIYHKLQERHGAEVELFASFWNAVLPYYCGLFPDLEHRFGCLGSYWTTTLRRGVYVANPPFHMEFMNTVLRHLRDTLATAADSLTIYITLPAWRAEDREFLNQQLPRHQRQKLLRNDYEDVLEVESILPFVTERFLFPRSAFPFWDPLLNKSVHYTPTLVMVAQNGNGPICLGPRFFK